LKEKDPDLILKALRMGVADCFIVPDDLRRLADGVRNVMGGNASSEEMSEVYSVFSAKGGQGVTSLVINLADHVHRLSREKVILVDLNLYIGNAAEYLDLSCDYSLFNLLHDAERLDDNLLFSSLKQTPQGFYLLGVSGEVSDAEQLSGSDITRIVTALKRHADYIMLDLPTDFSEKTIAAMEMSDKILLLVQQDVQSIKSAQHALGVFHHLGYDDEKIGIVLNRHTTRRDIMPDDIAGVLNRPVLSVVINDFRTFEKACNGSRTVDGIAPSSRLNKSLARFAERVTGLREGLSPEKGWKNLFNFRGRGFLGGDAR
jgi:pilus assembly protein CpaE